jgi:anti-sigma factor RsiW
LLTFIGTEWMADLADKDYELLSAYLDRELTEAEQTALEARLQAEPQLQATLEELRVVKQAVAALPIVPAPRDFRLAPTMAAPAILPRAAAQPRVARWWVGAAAALALVLVGLGVIFTAQPSEEPLPVMVAAVPTEALTPTPDEGAEAAVFEAALSAVELAPASTLPPSPEAGLTRQMMDTSPTAPPPMPMLAAPAAVTDEADEAIASMAFEAAPVDAPGVGQPASEAPSADVFALSAPDVPLQSVLREIAALLWALVQLALER